MKSHGLRLYGKQTVAARPAMAAMARVPPFVEGARMPSLAARPDAKAAKAAAPTGASTPCAGGGPRADQCILALQPSLWLGNISFSWGTEVLLGNIVIVKFPLNCLINPNQRFSSRIPIPNQNKLF